MVQHKDWKPREAGSINLFKDRKNLPLSTYRLIHMLSFIKCIQKNVSKHPLAVFKEALYAGPFLGLGVVAGKPEETPGNTKHVPAQTSETLSHKWADTNRKHCSSPPVCQCFAVT